jgi:Glycine zipper
MKHGVSRIAGVMVISASSILAACASQTVTQPVSENAVPSPPSTRIYFYPLNDQNSMQQDRDRYECYLWARQQTGFDPGALQLAPQQRMEVIPRFPPGNDAASGAVTGAIIGSIVTAPHDSAEGAIVGAVAGGIMGAAADAARQQEAETIQAHYDRQENLRRVRIKQTTDDYRRAMMACLTGRSYSVR